MARTKNRAFLAALAAAAVANAVACSLLAGYEDMHYVPSQDEDGGAPVLLDGASLPPLDLASATIYSVYPAIFSASKDFAGVTAKLESLRDLGFNVLSLMAVTPVGQDFNGHHSIQSPYCVHDYYAINSTYGSPADLRQLVETAHGLGMYVLLDEELNQTSWDNALIEQHPEYYLHDDGNPTNVASIEAPPNLTDVAQLDYQSSPQALQAYMTTMLAYWLTAYGVDGFRFITVDFTNVNAVPDGGPTIPADFWRELRASLVKVNPRLLMWGDAEDPNLGGAPFDLDYGWILRGGRAGATGGAGLQEVTLGSSATELEAAWQQQTVGYSGVLHVSLLENWDFDQDIKTYGGVANTMAAAFFDFTIDGVPMVWNGEEVGNDSAAFQTHTEIDWSSPGAPAFMAHYRALLALRNGNSALQRGTTAWIANSAPDQVVSYTRSDSAATFLVVINFADALAAGTLSAPPASHWTDESPNDSPGGTTHMEPPAFSLAPHDFALFRAN